jgi:copper oxidase (laccase) domain-containing protein
MDPVRKIAAAVHAGRQSTELQITSKTISFMVERFEVDPAGVYAAIGPCIRSCCYEVDAATAKKFVECCGGADGRTVDIAAANLRQLSEAGILNEKVFDCLICTSCENDRFFSYRKDEKITGRFITGIAIC